MAAATVAASAAPSSSSSLGRSAGERDEHRRRRERQLSGQHGSLGRRFKDAEAAEAGSETDSIESIYKQLSAPRKVSDSSFRLFTIIICGLSRHLLTSDLNSLQSSSIHFSMYWYVLH